MQLHLAAPTNMSQEQSVGHLPKCCSEKVTATLVLWSNGETSLTWHRLESMLPASQVRIKLAEIRRWLTTTSQLALICQSSNREGEKERFPCSVQHRAPSRDYNALLTLCVCDFGACVHAIPWSPDPPNLLPVVAHHYRPSPPPNKSRDLKKSWKRKYIKQANI